jgi:hypothetical protein
MGGCRCTAHGVVPAPCGVPGDRDCRPIRHRPWVLWSVYQATAARLACRQRGSRVPAEGLLPHRRVVLHFSWLLLGGLSDEVTLRRGVPCVLSYDGSIMRVWQDRAYIACPQVLFFFRDRIMLTHPPVDSLARNEVAPRIIRQRAVAALWPPFTHISLTSSLGGPELHKRSP